MWKLTGRAVSEGTIANFHAKAAEGAKEERGQRLHNRYGKSARALACDFVEKNGGGAGDI
jgi:hypothetical protein